MRLTLRPSTRDDSAYLWWLHCHTIRQWVEPLWGWDEAWQRQYFEEHFKPETLDIIEVDGQPAGCMRAIHCEDHIELDLIEIAPECQRQGLGTKLIGQLVVESDRRDVPIKLRVLTTNSAKRLYERLGFQVVQETAERYWMETVPVHDMGDGTE